MSDFVDRVGDPVGIVAADGSMHRSEALVVDSLRALAYTATGGRALPDDVALTYPAHWGPAAVDALGAALSRVPEWSHDAQPLLIPDAAAALFAMRANPGIPARGIVAVCDFGGSGTSMTLVDAAGDYQPVAATVRHRDFSGDLIDQALLTYVMSEMPATGSFDPSGTAAIGSLNRLRIECRHAKERLSHSTVTTLADELPGDMAKSGSPETSSTRPFASCWTVSPRLWNRRWRKSGFIRQIWLRSFPSGAGPTSRRSPPRCRGDLAFRWSRRRARS
ncbi:hypothetical protein NIIDMKKI_26170 [Mycobacterium kansasii]|uniref:Hsp70 family protein n=1 Tax=Mycobacterium kansasii TaxID=1768 RepID=A0A7G1I8S8_MYCKA|nr:hypothetical protein NIIDMKKI_26170 [Mycobacterium kansasii]